jgi:hypothetical protein
LCRADSSILRRVISSLFCYKFIEIFYIKQLKNKMQNYGLLGVDLRKYTGSNPELEIVYIMSETKKTDRML